jgi:hypothetical protein
MEGEATTDHSAVPLYRDDIELVVEIYSQVGGRGGAFAGILLDM